MYGDQPEEFAPHKLRLAAACPAATRGKRSRSPDAALERWKALHDAIAAWVGAGRPDDVSGIESAHFGVFDPLQRSLLTLAFHRCRTVIGDASVSFDPPSARVFDPTGERVLRVPFQFEFTHGDGDVELLRLKTGRMTTDDEAAVVALALEGSPPAFDLLADPGQAEEIVADPQDARRLVAELFAIAGAEPEPPEPRPGFHCWRCDRAALCGAYPDPWATDIPTRARAVKVSRTALDRVGTCERRVAWQTIHQIPRPEQDFSDTPASSLGKAFHEVMEHAVAGGDPLAALAATRDTLAPSERDELSMLWDRHLEVVTTEPCPVSVTRTEYEFGVSLPVPDADTVVVAIGRVDAAGREPDGTVAVVEYRTGASPRVPDLEAEFYAVATWLRTGETRVAVHHHHLRSAQGCVRSVFDHDDLIAALDLLVGAARAVAGWDQADALSVDHAVGPWCGSCDYEQLCKQWR